MLWLTRPHQDWHVNDDKNINIYIYMYIYTHAQVKIRQRIGGVLDDLVPLLLQGLRRCQRRRISIQLLGNEITVHAKDTDCVHCKCYLVQPFQARVHHCTNRSLKLLHRAMPSPSPKYSNPPDLLILSGLHHHCRYGVHVIILHYINMNRA